jgi:hypothetical protein
MSADSTPNEQRLLGLCQRLLQQNEAVNQHNQDLHAQIDYLCGQLRWLGTEYRTLLTKFNKAERDHTVQEQAAEIFLGAALDGPMSSAPGGRR